MKKSKINFAFRFMKYLNKSVALLLIFLLSTSPLMVFGEEAAVSADSTTAVSSDTPALTTEKPAVSTDTIPATAYYNQDGSYAVRDNLTRQVIQISNKFDSAWKADSTISNPYQP